MSIASRIRDQMSVIGSDGRRIGFATGLQGNEGLRLSQVKEGYGFEHLIPLEWVSDVDRYVFLNKSSAYVTANWETAPGPHRRTRAA